MIHHVFANRSNIGDWLSARGIQALLGPRPITEHFCDEPFVAATLERLDAAAAGDVIVIGGGGLFMDYFTPLWEGIAEIAGRVPCCIWGVGYCDLKQEPSRPSDDLLGAVIRRSRVCVVRAELSRGLLPGLALRDPVPCPSLAALDRSPRPGRGLLHVDNCTTAGANVFDAMDAIGGEFARRTDRRYRRTNNRIDPPSEANLAATLALYAESDLILSSALHGCIIGVALGKPILAVSGDYKIESFMEAASLRDWVLDLDEIDSLPGRLDELAGQRPCSEFVADAIEANRRVAEHVLAIGGLEPEWQERTPHAM